MLKELTDNLKYIVMGKLKYIVMHKYTLVFETVRLGFVP